MFDGKGYSVVNASLFMTNMRNGLSPSKKGTYYEKVLTLSAITQGGFDPEAWKDGVFDDCPPEDKRIRAFEFYMCRGNGNRTLVGTAVYTEENYPDLVFPDTVIAAHIDTEKVLLPYLHIAWKMPAIREQIEENARTTNGTYKINQKVIAGIEIILPSIEKQKEFVTLVEQSDKSKFISFKSQFIEMFGDPDNNSKNWPLVSLKDCLVAIDSGKSITCENYPRTGDLPAILKLSAVTYGEYQPEENKQLPLAEQFIKEAEVHVGDLLFSRKNTLEYVGMTAFVKQTPPKLMMPDLIFRLVPQENVRPQYLHQLINHPMYRGTISGLANGSAGSMPNISKQKLNNLAIPLPPVELQMEIEPFIEQSDKSK